MYATCGSWNLDNVIIAPQSLGGPPPILREHFLDNSAGWTLGAEWQIGPAASTTAAPAECGFGDPGFDADGPGGDEGIAGVVIGGYPATTPHPFAYLESPAVSTVGSATLYLEYDRWLNSDYLPYMVNRVEVFDGFAWVILWQSGGSPGVADATWTHHVFDITLYSNAALRVRFGFSTASGVFSNCGSWNLDNVTIDDELQPPPGAQFLRGDGNGDGSINIADAVHNLAYLFSSGPSTCLDAQDSNDDGGVNIADAVFSLAFLFTSGPPSPSPNPLCGVDPTSDSLDCATPPLCP